VTFCDISWTRRPKSLPSTGGAHNLEARYRSLDSLSRRGLETVRTPFVDNLFCERIGDSYTIKDGEEVLKIDDSRHDEWWMCWKRERSQGCETVSHGQKVREVKLGHISTFHSL